MLKYIPLQLVFFLIIGILIGFFFSFTPEIIIILLLIAVGLLAFIYFRNRKRVVRYNYLALFSYVTFIIIGIASVIFSNPLLKKNHYSSQLFKTNNASILIIDEVLKNNTYYNRYFAKIVSLNSERVQGKILLNIAKDSLTNKLSVDDKIFTLCQFKPISNPLNPYQFNYKNYLSKQQVYHQVSINKDDYLILENQSLSLRGWAYFIRKQINVALKKHGFKGDELTIIDALLLGQRQEISKTIIQNYQNAGAVHILAVSGLHVGIILLMITFLLRPLEKIRHGMLIKLVVIIFLLWAFALIAGLSASVIRAVSMFTAVAIAMTNKQFINIYQALVISMFFLLLFNPYYLFNVGFQLSYLAVFFIVWIQPMLYKLWSPNVKVIDYFWQLLTVSVAAQVGVLPLSLYYFHQFPGLFFVTNLAVIPFLGIIIGFGILVIVLALLNILPNGFKIFYEKVILLLNSTVDWVGGQDSFIFQNISFTLVSVVLYFLIVVFFIKWIELKKPKFLKFGILAIIGFQLNLIYEQYETTRNNQFIVFNKSRESIIGIKKGADLRLYHTLDSTTLLNNITIKTYIIGSKAKLSSANNLTKNVYAINNKLVLVIDSLGIYQLHKFKPNYIILRESPNINLERLIKTLKPELIVADASNYKSDIIRWKKTCKSYNIKFHYTVKDGAFIREF